MSHRTSLLFQRPIRFALWLLVAVIVPLGTGCASDKAVIAQAGQAHTELSKAVINDPMMSDYIQAVGDRIIETAQRLHSQGLEPKKKSKESDDWMFSKDMKFHFVNSKTLNAFTTGGEHMYVYTELLRRAKNEDELAAVMAHEYGHVFGRHVQNGMNRQMAVMLGAGAAAAAGYAAGGEQHGKEYAAYGAGLGMAGGSVLNAGFTRGDESEADQLGFRFYVGAGWDPDQFGNFFKTILEVEKQAGGAGPAFLSDHPATADRIANSEKWAQEWKEKHPDWKDRMKPLVASDTQFRQVQQRSVQIAGTMPDDKALQAQGLLAALPRSCMLPDEPVTPDVARAQQRLVGPSQPAEQQPAKRRRPSN